MHDMGDNKFMKESSDVEHCPQDKVEYFQDSVKIFSSDLNAL